LSRAEEKQLINWRKTKKEEPPPDKARDLSE
jgi:hypothetical protein